MEKRLLLITFLLTLLLSVYAAEELPCVHIQLWAPYDQVPSLDNPVYDPDDPLSHASRLLSEAGDFFVNAMVFGWDFSIAPPDSTRRIEGYADFTPIMENREHLFDITWSDVVFEQDRITAWMEFNRDNLMMTRKAWWNSIYTTKIHGTGESRFDGTMESLAEAVLDCARDAVIEHVRKSEKNKPKEITGSILLRAETPQIKIKDGKYIADLDFFVYVDKIVQYSYY